MSKRQCDFVDCIKPVPLVLGVCKFCKLCHCLKHRLPEKHCCKNILDCKQSHFNANKKSFETKEKTNFGTRDIWWDGY